MQGRQVITIAGFIFFGLGGVKPPAGGATDMPPQAPARSVAALLDDLRHPAYRIREMATRALLTRGTGIETELAERLAAETDAEARFRMRFVLENLRPPAAAVLVIRAAEESGLRPGDVITHVNNRPIAEEASLRRQLAEAPVQSILRVRGVTGPRSVGPIDDGALRSLSAYRGERGAALSEILRLYDGGFAEGALARLNALDEPPPADELSPLLQAMIHYTGGDGATALDLLGEYPHACAPPSTSMNPAAPSLLDLVGPKKAPYHLEWILWNSSAAPTQDPAYDPDTPIQRVLVPAGRYADALEGVAELWWYRYRDLLNTDEIDPRRPGNMLAISGWMLSEMDLLSECLRLIEPRSIILRQSSQGARKWVRVQTDAWLPFLRGDATAAIDMFYEDARHILHPPGPQRQRHIQNPEIAAQIGFFLYQVPADARSAALVEEINQPGYPPLSYYAYWMLYGITADNAERVADDLDALLPNLPAEDAGVFGFAAGLLDFARGATSPAPDAALARAPDGAEVAAWRAQLATQQALLAGKPEAADTALAPADELVGTRVLRSTARFLRDGPRAALARLGAEPLVAVPAGDSERWLVLTRTHQLLWVTDASAVPVEATALPAAWYPGPLNWPWLGFDKSSGRTWVYGRQRLVEVRGDGTPGVALNIKAEQIHAFERWLTPFFVEFARVVAAAPAPAPAGETGPFWRRDIRAGQTFVPDPDLPELGFIRPVGTANEVFNVALRGGPQLLIDSTSGTSLSSTEIAEQLQQDAPPRFMARRAGGDDAPALFLLSTAGLLRVDLANGEVRRIDLPGPAPHAGVVPEVCPYERADPRWLYFARSPVDGGQVYRLRVADETIEPVDMINEVLTDEYYLLRTRAELRAMLDGRFAQADMPDLRTWLADAERIVYDFEKGTQ